MSGRAARPPAVRRRPTADIRILTRNKIRGAGIRSAALRWHSLLHSLRRCFAADSELPMHRAGARAHRLDAARNRKSRDLLRAPVSKTKRRCELAESASRLPDA